MTAVVDGLLDAFYGHLGAEWDVSEDPSYSSLVVPNGNASKPLHRWFHMKEAFSCDLLGRVVSETGLSSKGSISLCDPCCGSATSGVSLAELVETGVLNAGLFTGLETNPFLHLVAGVKLAALNTAPRDFGGLTQRVAAQVAQGQVEAPPAPELSTFRERRYFSEASLSELLCLRQALELEEHRGADPSAVALALVCLGAAVEPCSMLRRDGRALRFEPSKEPPRPLRAFLARAEAAEADMSKPPVNVAASVHRIDARYAAHTLSEHGPFDLALFSPPYPNNIDYTEVYKLEAWMLNFYADQQGFASQRWRTIRSHASLDFGDTPLSPASRMTAKIDTLIEPLLDAVPDGSRYSRALRRTIRGYSHDMGAVLANVADAMKPGASLVYVVANSAHGTRDAHTVIAADLIIARLAELAGFEVDRIAIARRPSRRQSLSPYMRESVVFARKAGGV